MPRSFKDRMKAELQAERSRLQAEQSRQARLTVDVEVDISSLRLFRGYPDTTSFQMRATVRTLYPEATSTYDLLSGHLFHRKYHRHGTDDYEYVATDATQEAIRDSILSFLDTLDARGWDVTDIGRHIIRAEILLTDITVATLGREAGWTTPAGQHAYKIVNEIIERRSLHP